MNSLAAAAWDDARQAMTDHAPTDEVLEILHDVTVLDPTAPEINTDTDEALS